MFVGFADNTWIVQSPGGQFYRSEGAAVHVNLVRGLEVMPSDRLGGALAWDELVREALAGDPDGRVAAAAAGSGRHASRYGACPPAVAHHRVAAQAVGVIDVFISGKAGKDRLPQKSGEAAPSVLSCARVAGRIRRNVRQARGVVRLPIWRQPAIGTDRRTPEFHLHRAIECRPKGPRFRFPRRVPRRNPHPITSKSLIRIYYHASQGRETRAHMGNPG